MPFVNLRCLSFGSLWKRNGVAVFVRDTHCRHKPNLPVISSSATPHLQKSGTTQLLAF